MSELSLNESKSLQFELWQECNSLCDYCYLGKDNRFTSDARKLDSLRAAYAKISDMSNYPEFNVLGFIGGEFFQGQLANPEVRQEFFKLMRKAAQLYNDRVIRQVWICATMTIGHQKDLYEVLDLFNDHQGVWIISSWDTKGRFKTDKMFKTWDFHMRNIKKLYPDIKFNVTTILTADLISKYLANEISFKDMMDDYGLHFFFKQCGLILGDGNDHTLEDMMKNKIKSNQILPWFFPTRSQFLKFLIKFKQQESADMWGRLFNVKYRADELYRNFNDGRECTTHRYKDTTGEVDDSVMTDCGHPIVYRAYIDSHECVLCDKIRIGKCSD